MRFSPRLRAALLALLVTFLWSTSWVLIKYGLAEIPPLTFAGLRYSLAFLLLLPGLWKQRAHVQALPRREWGRLVALGLVYYALTQGGQFLTLLHLEAVTLSLLLSFTPLLVALAGIVLLRERLSPWQWAGLPIFVGGALLYFGPVGLSGQSWLGLALAGGTVVANAAASLLGRAVNRAGTIPPLVITAVSMGIGAAILLGAGLAWQGLPPLSPSAWAIVAWLAAVNTALAFTLWNHSLQTLSAVESSMINNTMLVQIAALAWLFLGERLDWPQLLGLGLAVLGVLLAQIAGLAPRQRP